MVSKSQKLLCGRLKKMRKRLRMTQEAFAETCGISYKYYQAIENGIQNDMRLSTLDKLADAYGIRSSDLIGSRMPNITIKRIKRAATR